MKRIISSLLSFTYEDTKQIADFILTKTEYRPKLGIICGSGLGNLVDQVEKPVCIGYKDIPGFPVSTGDSFVKFVMSKKMFLLYTRNTQ